MTRYPLRLQQCTGNVVQRACIQRSQLPDEYTAEVRNGERQMEMQGY